MVREGGGLFPRVQWTTRGETRRRTAAKTAALGGTKLGGGCRVCACAPGAWCASYQGAMRRRGVRRCATESAAGRGGCAGGRLPRAWGWARQLRGGPQEERLRRRERRT